MHQIDWTKFPIKVEGHPERTVAGHYRREGNVVHWEIGIRDADGDTSYHLGTYDVDAD